jgi:hypothetical protein
VYALVAGKNGPKMKKSAPDAVFNPGVDIEPSGNAILQRKNKHDAACGVSFQSSRPPYIGPDRPDGFLRLDPCVDLRWGGQQIDSAGPSLFTAV